MFQELFTTLKNPKPLQPCRGSLLSLQDWRIIGINKIKTGNIERYFFIMFEIQFFKGEIFLHRFSYTPFYSFVILTLFIKILYDIIKISDNDIKLSIIPIFYNLMILYFKDIISVPFESFCFFCSLLFNY